MSKRISYYEIVIRTTQRRLANETKRRVDRYDMNNNAEIRVLYEDKSRCPNCEKVLRKEELAYDAEYGTLKCKCGEMIDFAI